MTPFWKWGKEKVTAVGSIDRGNDPFGSFRSAEQKLLRNLTSSQSRSGKESKPLSPMLRPVTGGMFLASPWHQNDPKSAVLLVASSKADSKESRRPSACAPSWSLSTISMVLPLSDLKKLPSCRMRSCTILSSFPRRWWRKRAAWCQSEARIDIPVGRGKPFLSFLSFRSCFLFLKSLFYFNFILPLFSNEMKRTLCH